MLDDFLSAASNWEGGQGAAAPGGADVPGNAGFFDVADRWEQSKGAFPSKDERQASALGAAVQDVKQQQAGQNGVHKLINWARTKVVPFMSARQEGNEEELFAKSMREIEAGNASDESYKRVAEHLVEQDRVKNESTGRAILDALGHAPAIVGEAALTGPLGRLVPGAKALGRLAGAGATRAGLSPKLAALAERAATGGASQAAATPLMPSMWYEQSQQRATKNGGNWTDLDNLAPALAYGMFQNAVLGQIGGAAKGVPGGRLTATAIGGAAMPIETAGADLVTGFVDDNFLNDKWKVGTNYGTIGHLINGRTDDAIKAAAVQATIGAAFGAWHGKGESPVIDRFKDALDSLSGDGKGPGEAGRIINRDINPVIDSVKQNDITGAEKKVADILNEKVRKYGEALIPKKAPEPAPAPVDPEAAQRKAMIDALPDGPMKDALLKQAGEPEGVQTTDTPQSKLEALTLKRNSLDQAVNKAQADIAATAGDPEARSAANKALYDAKKARKAFQKELDAARDEVNRVPQQPAEAIKRDLPAPESGSPNRLPGGQIVEPAKAGEAADPFNLHPELEAGGKPLLEEMRNAPEYKQLAAEVPAGAKPIGKPNQAFVYETPAGQIVRIGRAGERADIPEMLQPIAVKKVGNFQVEVLPKADKVGDAEFYKTHRAQLEAAVEKAGYRATDLHPENVGEYQGKPVFIDPGAVRPMAPGEAAKLSAARAAREKAKSSGVDALIKDLSSGKIGFTNADEFALKTLEVLGFKVEPHGKGDAQVNAPADVLDAVRWAAEPLDRGNPAEAVSRLMEIVKPKDAANSGKPELTPEPERKGPVEPVRRNLLGEVMPKEFTANRGEQKSIVEMFDQDTERQRAPTEMGTAEDLPTTDTGMFKKGLVDDGGAQAAKDNAKFDVDQRILHRFPGEEGTESFVAARPDGKFYVSLRDREAGKSVPSGKVFGSEAEAVAHAKSIVGEPPAPKDPLSPLERAVHDAAERDMSYGDIAQLPETRRPNKKPYTRQRIEQIHRQALAKLGESKESLRKSQEAEKIDNALRMIERGQNVRPGELGPPDVVKKRIDRRIRAKDNADRTIENITNEFLKESEDAGPQGLSPERISEYDAKVRAALEGAAGTPPEAKGEARPVPAKGGESKRTQRNPNSLKNLKQNGRPKGIIHELRKEGGLDPEAFRKYDAEGYRLIMEGVENKVIPNPFLSADGRSKGVRHIEDVISERARTGDAGLDEYQGVIGADAASFIEKIIHNKPSVDQGHEEARIREAENAFYEKLEAEKAEEHKKAVEEGTDFEFGANAVDEATRMLWDKLSGDKPLGTAREADFEPTAEEMAALKPEARSLVQRLVDGFRKLGGAIAPATSRVSSESGNKIARYISAKSAGAEEAPHVIDLVVKPDEDPYGWVSGPVLVETRLRHMRESYIREAERLQDKARGERGAEQDRMLQDAEDLMTLAENVTTMVGKPMTKDGDLFSNPIANEEFYHQWAQSPAVIKTLARLSEHLGPRLNEMYRESEGFEPGEDLPYFTQLPGLEFHLQRWQPSDGGEGVITRADTSDTSPKLRNILARKNPFARLAKGNAEGYTTDLPAIIAYSLQKGRENAAKSVMYRQLVRDGLALPSKDGVRPGDDYNHELRGALPAAGMRRLSEAGQTSLWFKDVDVRKEVDQAINYESKWQRLPLTGALNWLTLASLGEVTAHTKNLMTMMLRPGMRFRDLAWNAKAVLKRDPIARQQLVDLATIGALKPEGFEVHDFAKLKKYNLMKYTGKFLDFVDRTMRLTADNAFARISRIEGVQKTEQARRDFINQLGQYNKRAQNHLVKAVRETGIGPFATAGTTWNVNALRTLFLGHGVRTDSLAADMKLRAAMLGRMAIAASIVPLANYLASGNVFGDENTPLGAIKVGTDSKGKTQYFDLMALTGLTRGLRMTGLLSFAEAQRAGAKAQGAKFRDAFDSATHMAVSSLLHPFEGPAFNFAHTAVTGENTFGQQIAATPSAATTTKGLAKAQAAGKPMPDESQTKYNFVAALINANPIAAAIAKNRDWDPAHRETSTVKEFMRQLGPYGVKTSSGPPGRPHRMMKVPVKTAEQHQQEKK